MRSNGDRPLRILTWHVHGNYLFYLTQTPHEFYLPVGRAGNGYAGCAPGFPWPANVHDVPIDHIESLPLDAILFQSKTHYLSDQFDLLSESQRRLPTIFLEHDPPQEHPTNTVHPVDDPDALLVHVTPFNELMWDSRRTPTRVIEHGVIVPQGVGYTGELAKGLVIVNGLRRRGRRLGADVFDRVRAEVPLDLAGMESEEAGGLGEISHEALPAFMCRYRFVFNPIRYTSLGLAVCEAMSLGVPIVGLATTEMVTAVTNGVSGYVDTDVDTLVRRMHELIRDHDHARRLGEGARAAAAARFSITRFTQQWDRTLRDVVRRHQSRDDSPSTGKSSRPLKNDLLLCNSDIR
ncbi:MAG TPA: glycosyltransferase [Nitrospiraceae bacterium]|nr:glycosyltransferase [Nitrospiraceae bacterium]